MLRSLHFKLVLVLVLLMVSIMTVVGTFLINSVAVYHLDEFSTRMSSMFTTNVDLVSSLRSAANEPDGADAIGNVLGAYSGTLGVDIYNRNYFVLDGRTGAYLTGSDPETGETLDLTPNILTAISGNVGNARSITASYIDAAVPISGSSGSYIVYIRDNKARQSELGAELFMIILESLLIGMVISVLLSFLLSKTITTPIEGLIRASSGMAEGDFEGPIEVRSSDEIGVLTETFNDMASRLKTTLGEVRGERNKLDALFLHMTDGMCAFDRAGSLIQMNPAARRMLDCAPDGVSYFSLFPDAIEWSDALALEPHASGECELERGGRTLHLFLTRFGEEAAESGVMVVIHDITEQTKLDAARREFVANVSHELRTPLTNVKSYTETLLENPDIDEETRKNFLSVVIGESDRMTRIVSDLLTLSKFDYGADELKIEKVDLRPLVEHAVGACRMEAERHGHETVLEFVDEPGEILCDAERIEQVFANILSNAIKYTPDGGRIETLVRREPGFVLVRITDNGVGIPEEALGRLGERFYRVDKARSRAAGGSGLGLSIAKEIVERHGGDLEIKSVYGKGTSVYIRLPLPKEENA